MPLIPWTAIVRATGRLAATEAAAALVNPVLDAYCTLLPPINDFFQDAQNFLVPGLGDTLSVPRRTIDNIICPGAVPPPASAAPGTWTIGCNSFGNDEGQYQQDTPPGGAVPSPVVSSRVWGCGDNVGLPIGAPFFANASPEGASWGYFITCRRADGSTHVRELGASTSDPEQRKYTLTTVNFFPCPGCNVPPNLPPRPIIPSRPTPPSFPITPQIPVTISLPQLPGFPPIAIPLVYAPIRPTIDLNAPITLAPNIGFNPAFEFAPTIELNLGGISIGGGGYPEPIPDVEDIIRDSGGDCPDPCPELDYDLIRAIAFEELDNKFPPARPFDNLTLSFGAAESNTFVLPQFATFIELTIVEKPPNVRTQTGGADAPEVSYNGWYSFGATAEASERVPLNYDFVSIPVPPGVSAFSYTVYSGGTASITIGYKLST